MARLDKWAPNLVETELIILKLSLLVCTRGNAGSPFWLAAKGLTIFLANNLEKRNDKSSDEMNSQCYFSYRSLQQIRLRFFGRRFPVILVNTLSQLSTRLFARRVLEM